jgi:hypothetical protein
MGACPVFAGALPDRQKQCSASRWGWKKVTLLIRAGIVRISRIYREGPKTPGISRLPPGSRREVAIVYS